MDSTIKNLVRLICGVRQRPFASPTSATVTTTTTTTNAPSNNINNNNRPPATAAWSFMGFLKVVDSTHLMEVPPVKSRADFIIIDVYRKTPPSNSSSLATTRSSSPISSSHQLHQQQGQNQKPLLLERWWISLRQQQSVSGNNNNEDDDGSYQESMIQIGDTPVSTLAPLKVLVRCVYSYLMATDSVLRNEANRNQGELPFGVRVVEPFTGVRDEDVYVTARRTSVSPGASSSSGSSSSPSFYSNQETNIVTPLPTNNNAHSQEELPFCNDWQCDCGPELGVVCVSVRRMFSPKREEKVEKERAQKKQLQDPHQQHADPNSNPSLLQQSGTTSQQHNTCMTSSKSNNTSRGTSPQISPSLPTTTTNQNQQKMTPLPTPPLTGYTSKRPSGGLDSGFENLDMPPAMLSMMGKKEGSNITTTSSNGTKAPPSKRASTSSPLQDSLPSFAPPSAHFSAALGLFSSTTTKPKPKVDENNKVMPKLTPMIGASKPPSSNSNTGANTMDSQNDSFSRASSSNTSALPTLSALLQQTGSVSPPSIKKEDDDEQESVFRVGPKRETKITHESFGCAISASSAFHHGVTETTLPVSASQGFLLTDEPLHFSDGTVKKNFSDSLKSNLTILRPVLPSASKTAFSHEILRGSVGNKSCLEISDDEEDTESAVVFENFSFAGNNFLQPPVKRKSSNLSQTSPLSGGLASPLGAVPSLIPGNNSSAGIHNNNNNNQPSSSSTSYFQNLANTNPRDAQLLDLLQTIRDFEHVSVYGESRTLILKNQMIYQQQQRQQQQQEGTQRKRPTIKSAIESVEKAISELSAAQDKVLIAEAKTKRENSAMILDHEDDLMTFSVTNINKLFVEKKKH